MIRPTYQERLTQNKYALIAIDVGHKHGLQQPKLSELAWYLVSVDNDRHEQHLRMLAVKWCKSGVAR